MKVKSSILSMDEIVMLPSVGIRDRHHLPDCPGLYFVISDGLVLYVGKAKSILSRWRSHHRERQIDGEYPNARIHWERFDSSDFLLSVEAEYIRAINPRLNRTKVKKGRLCDSGFGPRIGLRFPAWHLNRLIVLSEVKMQSMAGLLQDTVQSWIEDNDVRLEGMIAELAMDDGITPDEWKDRALAKHEKKRNV
jgi:hypothetical protein